MVYKLYVFALRTTLCVFSQKKKKHVSLIGHQQSTTVSCTVLNILTNSRAVPLAVTACGYHVMTLVSCL